MHCGKVSPGWKGGVQRASLLSLGVAGMPSFGHRESQGVCWGGEAGQIVLSLGFRTQVQERNRCPDTWVSQSVLSCILPYGKLLGWGVGNTYRSILQMSIDSVSSEGVGSLPSWDCLLFSLHLRVDLVYSGGVLGRVLLFFFNASSFSDDMLFFVSVSWRIISYFPCP